jgi:carotenoid cleavage dioxygenase
MPLGGDGRAIRWVDIDPCFVYHGTNAWREGADVVLDVSRIPDSFASEDERTIRDNRVERWRIGTGGTALTFAHDVVVDRAFDLPTVAARVLGRAHDTAYYVEARNADGGYEFGGLASVDRVAGTVDAWEPGFGFSAGEPCIVGDWLLAFVYDHAEASSRLDVLAATDLAAGPVASVLLPRRVPFGFHGTWLPEGVA